MNPKVFGSCSSVRHVNCLFPEAETPLELYRRYSAICHDSTSQNADEVSGVRGGAPLKQM